VQSYQTDVTVSSEASDNEDDDEEEDNMSSAESEASGDAVASEGEYTPVEVSSDEELEGPAVIEVFKFGVFKKCPKA
jgi:hypothetical protein